MGYGIILALLAFLASYAASLGRIVTLLVTLTASIVGLVLDKKSQ